MDELAIKTTKVRVHLGIQLSDHQIVIDRAEVPRDVSHAEVLREVANQLDQQEGKPVPLVVSAH